MRSAATGLALILMTAACVTTPADDSCGATDLAYLVGQAEPAAHSLPAAAPVRILYPDSMRTEDYRPDRINIEIGADGYIDSVWCG